MVAGAGREGSCLLAQGTYFFNASLGRQTQPMCPSTGTELGMGQAESAF